MLFIIIIVKLSKHFCVIRNFQSIACYVIVQATDIYIKNNKGLNSDFLSTRLCHLDICVVFILSGTHINRPHSLYASFIIASFEKCFFLDRFPCFFKGTNWSMILL